MPMRKGKQPGRTGGLESRWAVADRLLMHARVSDDPAPAAGPAVVLVHGLVVSGRYMIPTAQKLAPHHGVYVPDLPGFGRSEKPPSALDVAGLSDSLAAWMEAVGLGSAVLVGNSVGCQVVADLALRRPERVRRAVLQGPTMDPEARTALRQAARLALDGPREPVSLLPIMLLDYLSAGLRRSLATFRYALEDRIEDKLPHLRVPTLVVRGERDPIVPQRWAERAARLLPEGRLVVVPGAAHTMNYAAPSELARVVRSFLGEGEER
jgi:2-hydroxy-6-oxonona-2,4-dienedioate hydrolase